MSAIEIISAVLAALIPVILVGLAYWKRDDPGFWR